MLKFFFFCATTDFSVVQSFIQMCVVVYAGAGACKGEKVEHGGELNFLKK